MEKLNKIIKSMDFDFFGSGKHKVTPSIHLADSNAVFLDVRSREEFETISFNLSHHMPVLHIPIDEIPGHIAEIPEDKNIGVFCSSGVRSTMVYLYLRTLGFENVKIIEGGYAELADELKPGKLLKHLAKKDGGK